MESLISRKQIELRTIIIMASIALIVAISGFTYLYHMTLESKKIQLLALVKSQARLMEAVAKFDAFFQSGNVPGAAKSATLSQIKESNRIYEGFGETGELVLAERRGDQIIFLLPTRKSNYRIPSPIDINSELAGPMKLAVSGQSGVIIADDFTGVEVVAAYEYLPFLEMGLVAKVDTSEIMAPFYKAGRVTGIIALIAIAIGAFMNSKMVRPLVQSVFDFTEKIKEQQEQYSSLVSNIPGVVYRCNMDEDWTMLFISDEIERLSGYPASDFLDGTRNFSSIMHPDDIDRIWKNTVTALEDKASYTHEYRVIDTEGKTHWVLAKGRAMYNEEGLPEYLDGTIFDVTEKREAEAGFRKLSRAVEQTPAAIVITDTEGTIEYVNPGFSDVTGYTSEEAIGQNPRILRSEKNPHSIYKELWETILDGRTWKGELINRIKSGDEIWESVSISPVTDESGKTSNFVAVKEDITERKKMEAELHDARVKAEEATKAKSDFLANMSHEIRTPMNAIIGMGHLAMKTDLSPKQRDYLAKIQMSSNSLLGIINDILDFSKIEAGKLDMEETNFYLDEVLTNLANLTALKAEEKGLELLFNVNSETPTALVGDPLRLGQILINLANNAVKFTEQGEIVIKVEPLEISDSKATLHFSVQDSGIGLTEKQQSKLFQAFSQADTSTTRKYGGTGLGLTISKRLCEMMGGRIWVESEPGVGSKFQFTAVFGRHIEKKIPLLPEPDLREKRVLVVDDNQTSRDILQDMLESMSFKVSQSASGKEAITEIIQADKKGEPFEVIYMDWQMPDMNGIATSKKIKEQGLARQPRIIMVTAYGREEIMQQAEKINLDGFLVKPVSRSLLFDATMQAFGRAEETLSAGTDKASEIEALQEIRGARVLLAEDNEINQQVAQEILEQAGLVVDIANNGQEAMDLVQEQEYDAVLMDIQMPVMGGFESTKAIRNLEEPVASIPIIAMTAHAMAGDREKSIDAGMDDHITKPIDPDELFSSLMKWIKPGAREIPEQVAADKPETAAKTPALPDNLPGIDLQTGLGRVGGNRELYRNLLFKFQRDYRDSTQQVKEALELKDQELSTRLAHTVKGVAGNLGAKSLQSAAADLEAACKNNDLKNIDSLLDTFQEELQIVYEGIAGSSIMEESAVDESARQDGDPAKLAQLLEKLAPAIKKKKPKPSKEIMAEIAGFSWPDELTAEIEQLDRLIKKYKFKDAQAIMEALVKKT
jgi:PAS domain S-box-containing protein